METLGSFLGELRRARGLTFRDLEEKTGISNGYLNLLEHDRVKRPSPELLFKLSNFYGVGFSPLMRLAGYPTETAKEDSSTADEELATALLKDLTKNELERVRDFIGYLRAERRRQQ